MTTCEDTIKNAGPYMHDSKIVVENPEMVDHPDHYNAGGIECIDAIKSAVANLDGFEGFITGNAIKYLWRWKLKNGIQDLDKAQWYIDRLIEEERNAM